jgi:hypothetical protein
MLNSRQRSSEPQVEYSAIGDAEFVTDLADATLRGLLIRADGLSLSSLLHLGVAADVLRETEGLEPVGRTAQL